jgi:hypothetical protein
LPNKWVQHEQPCDDVVPAQHNGDKTNRSMITIKKADYSINLVGAAPGLDDLGQMTKRA